MIDMQIITQKQKQDQAKMEKEVYESSLLNKVEEEMRKEKEDVVIERKQQKKIWQQQMVDNDEARKKKIQQRLDQIEKDKLIL